jgi:fructose-1,6-bisphosphatase II / sedoheptulose-1,7-bisphosphatase
MVLSQKKICQEVTDLLLEASQKAAISASSLVGYGKKNEADELAVKEMRNVLRSSSLGMEVVIGEGEMDEAPMLYIGEQFGEGNILLDIAVDPLEGTNLCAKNMPNSITTIAVSEKGGFLKAPDCYMQKIASGKVKEAGVLDIDFSVKQNIQNLAKYLKKDVSDIEVVMLERERHKHTIDEIRSLGARVSLISDGDIYGIIKTTPFGDGGDLYLGDGGAPEGVLASTIIKACGGFMMGRLKYENEEQKKRAIAYGILDPNKALHLNDLVKGDTIFVASGVTNGNMLQGVQLCKNTGMIKIESIVFKSIQGKTMVQKITSFLEKSYL